MMAMLWAQQIMLGKKTFAQVPRLLKEQGREILIDSGMEELVTSDFPHIRNYPPNPLALRLDLIRSSRR